MVNSWPVVKYFDCCASVNKVLRLPKGQPKWTIQRYWQHKVHKTKKDKIKTNTICVGHHSTHATIANAN
jgi:hypothetical protein